MVCPPACGGALPHPRHIPQAAAPRRRCQRQLTQPLPQQDGDDAQNQNQYQWTYRHTRRRGSILGKIFLIYLLFQLFYGLFGGCSYVYLNPYGYSTYDNSSSYSDTYQSGSQQTDPYYGYGFGSQKSTNTQEG